MHQHKHIAMPFSLKFWIHCDHCSGLIKSPEHICLFLRLISWNPFHWNDIWPFFFGLTKMSPSYDRIDGSFNQVSGTLPTELGNMRNLGKLDLFRNSIDGALLTEIRNMNSLVLLNLQWNLGITGTIPPEFCNMEKLEELNLYYTDINGPVPQCLNKIVLIQFWGCIVWNAWSYTKKHHPLKLCTKR